MRKKKTELYLDRGLARGFSDTELVVFFLSFSLSRSLSRSRSLSLSRSLSRSRSFSRSRSLSRSFSLFSYLREFSTLLLRLRFLVLSLELPEELPELLDDELDDELDLELLPLLELDDPELLSEELKLKY